MLKPKGDENKIPFIIECPIRYKLDKSRRDGLISPFAFVDGDWQEFGYLGNRQNHYNFLPEIQPFGVNGTPFYKELGWIGHNGIDLKAPMRTNVYAACDGVIYSLNRSWGAIFIENGTYDIDGVETKFRLGYGHLDEILVEPGDTVKQGELIGYADNKGKYTTGSHLHLQVEPYYKNSRGRWYKDVGNGYAGAINFNINNFKIYYSPMKHIKERELIDYLVSTFVSGISEEDFAKLQKDDKKTRERVRKQMIERATLSPLSVIRVENKGEVMVEK